MLNEAIDSLEKVLEDMIEMVHEEFIMSGTYGDCPSYKEAAAITEALNVLLNFTGVMPHVLLNDLREKVYDKVEDKLGAKVLHEIVLGGGLAKARMLLIEK